MTPPVLHSGVTDTSGQGMASCMEPALWGMFVLVSLSCGAASRAPAPSTVVPTYHPRLSGLCPSPRHGGPCRHCWQRAMGVCDAAPTAAPAGPWGLPSACLLPSPSHDVPWRCSDSPSTQVRAGQQLGTERLLIINRPHLPPQALWGNGGPPL